MAASRRNRYSRSTTGLNAIGFFSPAIAYTAQTTYTGFVSSAAVAANNGTMAIIDYPALTVRTSALTAGLKFFIAQIVDGDIKKSPIMIHDGQAATVTNQTGPDLTIKKTVYSAPVLQSIAVGYNGTTGDLGLVAGTLAAPLTYVLSARDTSPSTQPFPVQEGRLISKVSTASKAEMTFALASDFVNAVDYEESADINFVTADVRTNGTNTNIATTTVTVINGSTNATSAGGAPAWAVGDIIEFTATNFSYKIVQVISATQFVLDRPYQGASFTTAAGGTGKKTVITATGIYVTAIVEDTTFVLSTSTLPLTIPPTVVTAWKQGSGAAWQARAMEEDTAVMSGYTNANMAWVQDMGQPTFFVTSPETSATQYTMYFMKFKNVTDSMAYPNETTSSYGYIIMGIPNGGGPQATIDTVLTT